MNFDLPAPTSKFVGPDGVLDVAWFRFIENLGRYLDVMAGVIPTTSGGTGLVSYNQGDLIYAPATDTLAALPKNATATRYLSNTGPSNSPAWAQVALANGVSGVLPLANGGSNKALVASNGGLVYTDADSMEILAGTATAGQVPRSGATAAPSWSTFTVPATFAAGDLLHAAAANVVSALPDVATGNVLLSGGIGVAPAYGKVDLTSHVTGLLPLANGGLNANLTASNGGVFYSTSTAGAILSGIATANKPLVSGASAAPAWSAFAIPATVGSAGQIPRSDGTNWAMTTATYPATMTVNQILHATATDVIGGVSGFTFDGTYMKAPNIQIGTHAGLAGETLSGFITIRDNGGTNRKIGVVS